ncbi:MAG TPA: hypothetical protein VGT40_05220 [Methylomirabilota bacterium]|nr:hypothetical protein [Methylomirabilota bacterium]
MSTLKGRIAEALVESIFRKARYQVAFVGRETHISHLIKVGRDEFFPDLLAWRPVTSLHQLVAVEVKYQAHLEYFALDQKEFSRAAEQWPDLYLVLVTDNPEPGRSCFQVQQYAPHKPARMIDLHEANELGIWRANVEKHEGLVKRLFAALDLKLWQDGGGEEGGPVGAGHISEVHR